MLAHLPACDETGQRHTNDHSKDEQPQHPVAEPEEHDGLLPFDSAGIFATVADGAVFFHYTHPHEYERRVIAFFDHALLAG